jgi:DNA-binding response OmpR family regulator
VPKSVVVVADTDAWVPSALAAGLPESFEVVPCTTARGALNACCALEPDVLVAASQLADLDGLWLAAAIRAQSTAVSLLPILLLEPSEDEESAVNALRSGVDVVVPRPFNVVELVAQIRALIAMAARLRARAPSASRPSFLPAGPASTPRAIAGDLSRMPVATVLGALELDRLSGELRLRGSRAGARELVLRLARGILVGGRLGIALLSPVDALAEALHWEGRRFHFTPENDAEPPAGAEPIARLLIQALARDLQHLSSRASARSGTRARVEAGAQAPPLAAPGRRLVESLAPSIRPDPRAEEGDESPTVKLRWRV